MIPKSRPRFVRLAAAIGMTIAVAGLPGTALAGDPARVSHDRSEFAFEVTDTNICGDLGVFSFSGTAILSLVERADDGFHFLLVERGTYTLTFPDGEVWASRFVETVSVHASPNGSFSSVVAFNSFEGPIRIHEMTTYVVGPDGTVRVDDQRSVVDECPAA